MDAESSLQGRIHSDLCSNRLSYEQANFNGPNSLIKTKHH